MNATKFMEDLAGMLIASQLPIQAGFALFGFIASLFKGDDPAQPVPTPTERIAIFKAQLLKNKEGNARWRQLIQAGIVPETPSEP